jgi:hypothetical chaperone protein
MLVPLEADSPFIPSTLYTSKPALPLPRIDEEAFQRRVARAIAEHRRHVARQRAEGHLVKELSDAEIRNRERASVRRESTQARTNVDDEAIEESLQLDDEVVFGTPAIKRNLKDPQAGFFVGSPKSFLGSDVSWHHQQRFVDIITRMLANTKTIAEGHLGTELRSVVLGRPVNFSNASGEAGNRRAVRILESSALDAGFETVEFLEEPIAAALEFERTLQREHIALIVDVGAGTTDCSVVRLDPSSQRYARRDHDVLGASGVRVGGLDMDIKLAMRCIMPLFGLGSTFTDGLPIPLTVFWNAIAINDVNAQAAFFSDRGTSEVSAVLARASERHKLERLVRLHTHRLSYQVNRTAEATKISLSTEDETEMVLDYVEPSLSTKATRSDLRDAVLLELKKLKSTMEEAVAQAQTKPSVVFITGGSARSPLIQDAIKSEFQDTEIIAGDAFGSVASGLAVRAHQLFR